MASESIILEAIDFVPDVVLMINGMQLHRRAYELLHRLKFPVVLITTESPYLDEWHTTIINKGHVAGVLVNDKASVESMTEVGVPIAYLPHSYDVERHRVRPPNDRFMSDIFFHGTLWPERQRLFMPLADLLDDYTIHIDGIILEPDGRVNAEDLMSNNEMAIWYANAKIVLNQHRTVISGGTDGETHIDNGMAYSIGPRAYEAAACGAFQLCDDTRPELHDVFNGYVPTYKDGQELAELVRYYLTHDEEREQRAAAAREAVQGCSFDDRVHDIVIPFIKEITNGRTI